MKRKIILINERFLARSVIAQSLDTCAWSQILTARSTVPRNIFVILLFIAEKSSLRQVSLITRFTFYQFSFLRRRTLQSVRGDQIVGNRLTQAARSVFEPIRNWYFSSTDNILIPPLEGSKFRIFSIAKAIEC